MSLSDSDQTSPIDPWKGCNRGVYAYDFRSQLISLAKDLRSKSGAIVYSRFNEKQALVEFVAPQEEIIAMISISGSGGEAWAAEVHLKDMSQKNKFETALRPLETAFEELT